MIYLLSRNRIRWPRMPILKKKKEEKRNRAIKDVRMSSAAEMVQKRMVNLRGGPSRNCIQLRNVVTC